MLSRQPAKKFFAHYASNFRQMSKVSTRPIGFIGIGNMGSRMMKNLLNKGEHLMVFDTQPQLLEPFQNNKNITVANSVKQIAQESSCIITMLPNNDSVKFVYADDDQGILKNCTSKNAVFLDCSTVAPRIAQDISAEANEKEMTYLDAPVSGGVVGAEAGTLTFMVGGNSIVVKNYEPLLLKMGTRVVHCGASGMGQATKLCNNLLLFITMAAVAETMNLGIKFGLDVKLLTSVVNSSSGRCWATEVYHPVPGVLPNVPSSQDYQGGFKSALLLKDMQLALNLAKETNVQTQLADKAFETYNDIVKSGFGDKDFSVIYEYLSNKNVRN